MSEPRCLLFVRSLKMTTWHGVDWAPLYKHATPFRLMAIMVCMFDRAIVEADRVSR
jgi:hypothetical protein